jgi:hypothetical protein
MTTVGIGIAPLMDAKLLVSGRGRDMKEDVGYLG